MKQFIFLLSLLYLVVSCESSDKNNNKSGEQSYADYFYPTDSVLPYIYIFQNVDKPLDEKILRIYRTNSETDTSLVVEFYNSDMKITEGYTHDITDGFKVQDHMIVDGEGLKRQAKLTSNTFFPKNKDDETQFLSDFPSHLDSITMIYHSKRRVLDENAEVNVLGDKVPAIIIEDSVKVLLANPFTKKSSEQNVMISRTFAKGYGLVRWSANNEKIVYELVRILPNKWWEEYGQSPQVKL